VSFENAGVGPTLRDARAHRGITITQLSDITKISQTILRAIEQEDVRRLPGGIFTRGFLRTYACEVGLDPDETVTRWAAQFAPAVTAPVEAVDVPAPADPNESEHSTDFVQTLVVALIVVAGAAYLGLHSRSTSSGLALSAAAASERPVGTSGTMPTATGAQQPAEVELRVEVSATGPCWFSAAADGMPVTARLLDAGDQQTIKAFDEVQLRVGDPAMFSFSINGAPGRTLGEAGRAATLHITPQNYRQYLR
jgi:cytoskeleton protein RodZ